MNAWGTAIAGVLAAVLVFWFIDRWINKPTRHRLERSTGSLDRLMLEIDADLREIQYSLANPADSRRVFGLRDKIQLEYAKIKGEVPRG